MNKISHWWYTRTIWIFIFIGFTELIYAQFDIPPKPAIQTSVYDYAKILLKNQKNALEQKLLRYADTTSTQIVVVTVPTIKQENIGLLAPRWAHEWGVGDKEKENGVFILVGEKERKIWISPGYGLEHLLTAGVNGEIIRNIIIPEFKKRSYYSGLDKGTDALIALFSGTYRSTSAHKSNNKSDFIGFLLFVIIIILFLILSIRKNKNNDRNSGGNRTPDLWDVIILSNMGRSSGSSGSFGSSRGFGGGFGGGGFSGGGAGGSW